MFCWWLQQSLWDQRETPSSCHRSACGLFEMDLHCTWNRLEWWNSWQDLGFAQCLQAVWCQLGNLRCLAAGGMGCRPKAPMHVGPQCTPFWSVWICERLFESQHGFVVYWHSWFETVLDGVLRWLHFNLQKAHEPWYRHCCWSFVRFVWHVVCTGGCQGCFFWHTGTHLGITRYYKWSLELQRKVLTLGTQRNAGKSWNLRCKKCWRTRLLSPSRLNAWGGACNGLRAMLLQG